MAKSRKARHPKRSAIRAQRFSIHAPVRYRVDNGPWRQGTTENISRSGLLFHAEEALTRNTAVEMVVELPSVLEGERSARVVCRGRIVRSEAWEDVAGTILAAEIRAYRFGRDQPAESVPEDS